MRKIPEITDLIQKAVESRVYFAFIISPLGACLAFATFIQVFEFCFQIYPKEHIHLASEIDILSVPYFAISLFMNVFLYATLGLIKPFDLSNITTVAALLFSLFDLIMACTWLDGIFLWLPATTAVLLEVVLFCFLAGVPVLPQGAVLRGKKRGPS